MKEVINRGAAILTMLAEALEAITPEEYAPPTLQPPTDSRLRMLGEATDYQKGLITLRDRMLAEHEQFHLERHLSFGGHIDLPLAHEFWHAAHQLLETLLVVNLANTFKELSGEVSYYISPTWKVNVIRPATKRLLKRRERPIPRFGLPQ